MYLRKSRCALILCLTSITGLVLIRIIRPYTQTISLYTKEYNTYWKQQYNANYTFYDSNTFGVYLFNDSCQVMRPQVFRNYLNSRQGIDCNGKWCYRNYHCRKGDSRNCYNVEHIIDSKGPELPHCNKNVPFNYVMAWGTWNQNLGRIAQWNYNMSAREKTEIYGKHIMDMVRNRFEMCCI